jgi:hypothetical protein
MDEEYDVMLASSLAEVIIKMIEDDCLYSGMSLEDTDTRASIIAGIKDAAVYFESYNKLLH